MPPKRILRKPKIHTGGLQGMSPYDMQGMSPYDMQGMPYDMQGMQGMYPNGMQGISSNDNTKEKQVVNAVKNPPKSWSKWLVHEFWEIANNWDTIAKTMKVDVQDFVELNPVLETKVELPIQPLNRMHPPMYGGIEGQLQSKANTVVDSKKVLTPITKSSWTYILLVVLLVFTLTIAPFVLLGLSLYYSSPIWYSFWFGEQYYLEDSEDFKEARNMYKIGSWYMQDYVLYVAIILIVFLFASIYLSLTVYIKHNNAVYIRMKYRVYIAIALCTFVMICYLAMELSNHTIQQVGISRDSLSNIIYENLNYDYINYLNDFAKNTDNKKCDGSMSELAKGNLTLSSDSSSAKCYESVSGNLVYINNQQRLQTYIKKLINNKTIDEIKSAPKPDYIKNMDDSDTVFDLVVKTIITYRIISGLQAYSDSRNKHFDENSFKDIMRIIASVSVNNYSIFGDYNFTYIKCIEELEGMGLEAVYMKTICEKCDAVAANIDDSMALFKKSIGNISFPRRLGISTIITIIFVFYILSILANINAIRSSQTPVQAQGQMPGQMYG
jgi:hypothetical protein